MSMAVLRYGLERVTEHGYKRIYDWLMVGEGVGLPLLLMEGFVNGGSFSSMRPPRENNDRE